jgi:NAD(P)-dependent dehydrogenase (short-subunit alcohol dehydrogenase family)
MMVEVTPESPSLLGRVAGRIANLPGSVDESQLERAVGGKVVLVTGASRGIGEATARRLAAAGATVLLAARGAERLEEVAAEINGSGGIAVAMPADLSDPEQARALAEDALSRFGHVDILVSNAGKSINRSIKRSLERFHDYERTTKLNFLGPVQLVLALLPSMLERGEGHIVNISTAGVLAPAAPGWSAYIASKTAFDVFMRTLDIELADQGIEITSVYMTLVETEMSAPNMDRFRTAGVPSKTPEEAAESICSGIANRRSRIAPWWSTPVGVLNGISHLGPDQATRLFFRAMRRGARREHEQKAIEPRE